MGNIDINLLRDHKFYLENFCQLKVKAGGLEPFILNKAQKDLFNTLNTNNRIIVLKARQLGFSTGVCGYFYVEAITTPGINVAIIAYNADLTAELLDKIKTFHRTTPAEIRPQISYNSKYEMFFPKLDSKILVLPSSENVGSGYTIHRCLLSELSKIDKAEEKMASLLPAIPPTGKLVIESCVTGDTIIFTNNGPRFMEDLYKWDKIGIFTGNKILVDGHYGMKETNTYHNNGIREGYRIKTKGGYELGMSSVHKIFVLENNSLLFKEAKDIKIGDIITIKYGQETWGNNDLVNFKASEYGFNKKNIKKFNVEKITKDLAYLIGMIIGDGFVYKDKHVTITTADEDVYNFLFNNNLGLKFYHENNKTNNYQYRCTNKSFVEFLRYIGIKEGKKSSEKEIPKIILEWSRENVIAFLQGLFDADGCCRSDRGTVSFVSTSNKIIDVLRILLLNFGILSKTFEYISPPTKRAKVYSHHYVLEINRCFSEIFLDKIGFRINRKQNNKKLISNNYKCLGEYIPKLGHFIKENIKILGLKYSDVSCGLNKSLFSKSGNITYSSLEKILNKCRNKESKEYNKIKELFDNHYYYEVVSNINIIKENVYDFTVDDGHTVTYSGIVGHQSPRGMGNLFHRLWMSDGDYVKKKYGWWWGYTEVEIEQIRNQINNPSIFAQEYEMEFLSSGRSVFSQDVIKQQRKNVLNIGDKYEEHIVYKNSDDWIIYKEPEADGIYVCGADISEGVDGGDNSVGVIFNKKTGEEVAFYCGLISPDRFGEVLNKIGRFYNNALMVVESNNHGLTTITILRQLMYPSLYFRPAKFETMGVTMTDRIGWRTTKVTRFLLIDEFDKATREKVLIIHSKKTLDEMSTFIYDNNNNMVSSGSFHDDTIFATAICYQGFKIMYSGKLDQLNYEEYLPKNYAY